MRPANVRTDKLKTSGTVTFRLAILGLVIMGKEGQEQMSKDKHIEVRFDRESPAQPLTTATVLALASRFMGPMT